MTADIASLRRVFEEQFGHQPQMFSEAPGRVNLIGEHTDYNDGLVLPVAIDRTIAVAVAPREDNILRAYSLDHHQCDEFPVNRVRRFMGTRGGWRDYVRGVCWALQDANIELTGADLAITGDVPQGAGLSSSAAVEMAVAGALATRLDVSARDLALLCQTAENLFVGVQCGIMDQFASALGREGHALFIDCRSLDVEPVPLPEGLLIAVIDSKVPRKLGETAYNQRRDVCAEAARALGVESLRDADESMLPRVDGDLKKRARHVITENQRVRDAVSALKNGDLGLLQALMQASHESLRADFEVSTPELDALVEVASKALGHAGPRLTGAGFGGCLVALVEEDRVQNFSESVTEQYRETTGLTAEMHICRAVDGLRVRDA
jgi:galactokinase